MNKLKRKIGSIKCNVPFNIIEPVLDIPSPKQLDTFDRYNPHLMDDSDVLWQQYCQRKFKAHKKQNMKSWRDTYVQCTQEQEAHLFWLIGKIKKTQSTAISTRKIIFVEDLIKPPRNVAKKQNRYGKHTQLMAATTTRGIMNAKKALLRAGPLMVNSLKLFKKYKQIYKK